MSSLDCTIEPQRQFPNASEIYILLTRICEYGKGHVICFSPHPEKTAGVESMVLKGIHLASHRRSHRKQLQQQMSFANEIRTPFLLFIQFSNDSANVV